MKTTALLLLLVIASAAALAQHDGHRPMAPYAGQDARDIKSLSAEDIAELRRGGGWGLAKAAELNGMPGPAHLLELRDQIGLTPNQASAIQAIFDKMRADAIREGERLIAFERALEEQFRNRAVTDQWTVGRNAVAAVFMHTEVLNDYILDFNTRSNTDWVNLTSLMFSRGISMDRLANQPDRWIRRSVVTTKCEVAHRTTAGRTNAKRR